MSKQPSWLAVPAIDRLISGLLARLDRLPTSQRIRAPRLVVDADTMPELFDCEKIGEPEYIWSLVERMADLGWVQIRHGRSVPGRAVYEVGPTVIFTMDREAEIRDATGHHVVNTYQSAWNIALGAHRAMTPPLYAFLKRRPIRIPGRTADAVIERLFTVRDLADSKLFLREVSGRLFWRHSKQLDRRADLIARILDVPSCPFPELPVLINCHYGAGAVVGVLFIENTATFQSARIRTRADKLGLALLFASGFKLAASRLRDPSGSELFPSAASAERNPGECIRIQNWLHSASRYLPTWFWGDLDFASMEILKRLRQSFPDMVAWQHGYGPMLRHLRRGDGIDIADSEKNIQVDPGTTGCDYADSVLLPAIRRYRLFVHQES